MTRIAIVGMACRYPDATSPTVLWENAIAGRRAFRRLPDVRMRLEDYWDRDPATPDRFYARNAAVIEGYEFDRIGHKIAGSTYRSTDLTHWLALDIAGKALADAGFPEGEGLNRERAGVVVGNTLTGEFTRANLMRLRWPYVRRTLAAALQAEGWDDTKLATFLSQYEDRYKAPFPQIDEDTLAGGLANTIAGRICNYFDLNGGGYIVDGACSSSLLSVVTAGKALLEGDIDVAIAGGVDLSIDPFEVIGFAKTGALAKAEMRVYDRGSNGFWPGEGCGMVVLMREEDARAHNARIYATVTGWGVSSDGKGGMTRPEVDGYKLALRRAYERSGFGIETVAMFEGHGTGTQVGDANELNALSAARTEADPSAEPAALSTIKALIGHTKAAAGIAGLIKATMAVHERVLPPTVGCLNPHQVLVEGTALRVLRKAEPWPEGLPARAGVTAMGFGGINTHVVLEETEPTPQRRAKLDRRTRTLASSVQDVELLLVDGDSPQQLRERVERLADFVPALSYAQLADLAATAQRELTGLPHRAAVVVSSPENAERQLRRIEAALAAGESHVFEPEAGCFAGHVRQAGRIGYLFPGQGSGKGTSGGALRRRFSAVEELYTKARLPSGADAVATAVAQPRIVTGSMAGLRALTMLGVEAGVAVGHSLGEISALHWAGAMDEETLLRVATVRGRTMTEHSASGTMAGLAASPDQVTALLANARTPSEPVVIAGYNGPGQTVVAGTIDAIQRIGVRAAAAGVSWTPLKVSHAFHSPLVAPAADAFGTWLAEQDFQPLSGRIVSTVTGDTLPGDTGVAGLLREQITEPVLFAQAIELAAKDVDLFIEVGPGRVLSGLVAGITDVPVVAMDTDDESLAGLLRVAGAAYVNGVPIVHGSLFESRLIRPLTIGAEFSFLSSPCEQAPQIDTVTVPVAAPAASTASPVPDAAEDSLQLLRRLAAERAELPLEMVHPESQLLDELHLSSITVGQILNQAAQIRLGVAAVPPAGNIATATIRELAEALDAMAENAAGAGAAGSGTVAGAEHWSRPFVLDLDEIPLPARADAEANGAWQVFCGPSSEGFAGPLCEALQQAEVGPGVLVCLPEDCTEQDLELALAGAKAAMAAEPGSRYALVQHGRGAAGLAKTLRLEAPDLRITIAHVPVSEEAVGWVAAEVAATADYAEVYYDGDGVRRVPTLRAMPVRQSRVEQPLDASDVVLVTGGGKGITAECALALAKDTGARLAVLGRSDPAGDAELADNLARFAAEGVTVHYCRADITDGDQVRAAVEEAAAELGTVTGILHGAGRNEPAALASLDSDSFRRTFGPKVDGLRLVLDAVDLERLRLLVTFGSIIGRAGLQGEGHYATANEWLDQLTNDVGRRYPGCRAICMEWSVWSGVGMGERLSVIDALEGRGIGAITPEEGVEIMRRLVSDPETPSTVVISSRTEGVDTVRYDRPELPLLRFVDKPLIHYPGIELVTEVEVNGGTDLYLADHHLDGNLLFPAVFGMEAMAQVAYAATGWSGVPVIEEAQFLRPIVVPPADSTTIRVAVTVTDEATVTAAIRSADTGYSTDHFRARLRFGGGGAPAGPPDQIAEGLPPVALDPDTDLYGDVLFQGQRFHRLQRYHRAAALEVDAEVAALDATDWFAGFLPGALLLGDPGMRDALMHGNQVCVPHATLLPTGIERIYPGGERLAAAGRLRFSAIERERDGDSYTYDIAVRDGAGEVVERWEGLHLQAVRKGDGRGPWIAPLLGPYLQRTLDELLGVRIAAAVEPGEDADLATARVLGRRGGPGQGETVSAWPAAGITLAVAAHVAVGCATATTTITSAQDETQVLGAWAEVADQVAEQTGELRDIAAARVHAAVEAMNQTGRTPAGPLTVSSAAGAWTVFACDTLRIATLATTVRGIPDTVVLAIAIEGS